MLYRLRTLTRMSDILEQFELLNGIDYDAHTFSGLGFHHAYPCYGCFRAFPIGGFAFVGEQWMWEVGIKDRAPF